MKTNENETVTATTSNLGFPLASAAVLIVFGIFFQLAELACRSLHLGNLWQLSVLASDIWNILSVRFNVPSMREFLFYWPLVMICLGLAIFLAVNENRPSHARKG